MPTFAQLQVMVVDNELAKTLADMPELAGMGARITTPGGKNLKPKTVIEVESLEWLRNNLLEIIEKHCDENHQILIVHERTWDCQECESGSLCSHGGISLGINRSFTINADKARQQLS